MLYGIMFLLGMFLLSCQNILVVIAGLMLMMASGILGGAFRERKKPRVGRR